MKIFLISNNLVLDNIVYKTDEELEQKRLNRPLSIEGEKISKRLSTNLDVQAIYSSNYASALGTAKYLSFELNIPIYIDSSLRDSKIGELGKKNIKMLRFMQERDFNYKFVNGESLNETKLRIKRAINKIIKDGSYESVAIFTHKRAILSFLLDYTDHGFNLDDRLILSYNDEVIIDDADKDLDLLEIEIIDNKVNNIRNIEI